MSILRGIWRSHENGCFIAGAAFALGVFNAFHGYPIAGGIGAGLNAGMVVAAFVVRRRKEQRQIRVDRLVSNYSDWRGKA